MELIIKSPMPVCIIDKNGKIHLANQAFYQLVGIQAAKEDKALKRINRYIEIDPAALFDKMNDSFCGYSSKILASSDILQISGFRIHQGEFLVLNFCVPSKSHCEREKEMQIERDFYRILRSSSLPLMIYNIETVFYLNDAAEDLLGYSRIYEPSPIPKDFLRSRINKKLYENAQARLCGENLPNTYDAQLITKTGSKKYIRISVQLITYQGCKALLATFTDLTDRIKLQKQLDKARKNLKVKVEKRTEQLQIWNENLEEEIHKRRQADRALEESEEKYRKLVEMANEIITTINRDGLITFINQYGADRLGLQVTEAMGRSLFDIFSPYYAEKHLGAIQHVIDNGQKVQYENVSELNGKEYWFNTTLQPIEKGNSTEALLIIYDITKMKNQQTELENYRRHLEDVVKARTEELSDINLKLQNEINEKNTIQAELIESREKYRFLVENQLEVVARIDINGKFNYVSPSCCKLLGKDERELLGTKFWHFVHEDDLKQGIEVWQQLRRPPYAQYLEQRIKTAAGIRWYAWSLKAVLDNKDCFIASVSVGRDITEKKHAEKELEKSEKRFRDVIDRSIDGYVFIDQYGHVQYQNSAMERLFGYRSQDVLNQAFRDFIWPDDIAVANRLFSSVMGGKAIRWYELRVKHTNGSMRWAGLNMRRVIRDGIVIGMEGFVKDITEQVNSRKRLKLLSARLVDIQEEERVRISREIHDSLGQSLTALQFEITATKSALETDVKRAKKMLDHSGVMLKESIALAQNLCYTLRPTLLDDFGLVPALRDYFQDFQQRWGIEVRFKHRPLNGDLDESIETALFRVTQEALNNILKHAFSDKIYIKLWTTHQTVYYLIRDFGKGFDTKVLNTAKNEKFGILGMKERIELQGGEFRIISRPGRGTSVFINIPLAHSHEELNTH